MGSFGFSMGFGPPSGPSGDAAEAQGALGSRHGSGAAGQPSNQHAAQAGQYSFPQPLSQSSTAFSAEGSDSAAFTELDYNQVPLQRTRAPAGKDSNSMGDQAKQEAPVFNPGFPAPPAAVQTGSWAAFLTGVQNNYASPGARGARAAGRRAGATPRQPSRMQQQGMAAGQAGAASPMFAFGSPMPASASGAAAAGGPTPAPPGTAMSTDSTAPASFGGAFTAMSVDAATPAFGSSSNGQPWAFRAGRAAAFTGKRLFDTPSSVGADGSAPSPLGSWGRQADGTAGQSPAAAGSRAAAEPVPFTGFGPAPQDASSGGSTSPPAGGFSFNLGELWLACWHAGRVCFPAHGHMHNIKLSLHPWKTFSCRAFWPMRISL